MLGILDDLMLWKDEPVIVAPGGRLDIVPGEEIRVSTEGGSWCVPISRDEMNAGDLLHFGIRRDGKRVFIGGAEATVALTIDFISREAFRIPLLRSRKLEDWDPGGLKKMYGDSLTDGRLLVVYESGIFLLDAEWNLSWHRELAWVHLGVNLTSVGEGDVAWMTSEWGNIGYRLADGAVLDPDGLYAWRASKEEPGEFTRADRSPTT